MLASNYTKVVITAEDKTANAFESAKRNIRSISNSSSDLIPLLGGVAAGFYAATQSVKLFSNQADTYSKFTALLKNSTVDAAGFEKALESVNEIARRSQSNVSGVATLYSRLSTSLTDLGVSQSGIARVTETISLGLKASGATAEESSSAMLQLSQAFGSGVLRGEEFNAVNEAAPALLRAIAESINQPVGALRQLATDGKLTSDVLYKAFSDERLLDKYRAQAAEIRTFSGALAPLQNSLTEVAGVFTQKTRAVDLFSGAVNGATGAIRIFKATAEGKGIDTSIDKVFSSYSKYREIMDKMIEDQGKVFNGKTNNILPSGSLLSDIPLRKDIGMIGQVDQAFEELKRKAAAFKAENPFKDKQADLDAYNQKINLLNDLESKGLVSVQEASRYRAQFNSVLDKGNKSLTDNYSIAGEVNKTYADMYKIAIDLNKPQESQIDQLRKMIDGFSGIDSGAKQWLQTQLYIAEDDALERKLLDQNRAIDAQIDSIYESVRATQFEIDTYGMLPAEITKIKIARLDKTKTDLESAGLEVESIQRVMDAYQELYSVQSSKQAVELRKKATDEAFQKEVDAIKRMQQEAERASDIISRSLTDALMRGFESGKTFAENFKDTLYNMFRTLVLQPVVKLLVDSSGITRLTAAFTGMLSGTANAGGLASSVGSAGDIAGGSSGSSILGVATNLYKGITSGFDLLNTKIVGSIGDLGTFLVDKGFNNLGGMIGQYNTQIANVLPYSAAIFKLLQGDVKGAAFTGVGTAIGSLWGPAGAGIGAALGSLVGGLFGGGTPLRNNAKIRTTYDSSTDAFSVTDIYQKRQGYKVVPALTGLAESFSKEVGGFLKELGSNSIIDTMTQFNTRPGKKTSAAFSGSVNGVAFDIGSFTYGKKDQEAWNKYVNEVVGRGVVAAIQASDISQGFKDLFTGFADKTQIATLMQSVVNFKTASEELADTYGITADIAARIARAGGSTNEEISAFAKTFSDFSLSLMKPSEQLLLAQSNITKSINEIVGSVGALDSLSAFDDLLKGIDATTATGQQQFAELFKLRDSFSSYISSLNGVKSSVDSTLLSLMTPSQQLAKYQADLASSFDALNISMPGSIDELIALGKSIDYTTEAGLDLALAFPGLVSAFQSAQSASDSLMQSLGSLDTSKFKSLVDYTRYKIVAGNYGSAFADSYTSTLPSYDVGTSYVPVNGPAMIHAGERILTATENADIVNAMRNGGDEASVVQALKELRDDIRAGHAALVIESQRMSKVLQKFDRQGIVLADIDNEGNDVVVKVEVVS